MGHKARQSPTCLAAKLLFIRTKMLGLSQSEMIRRLGFGGELIQSHISAYEQENARLRREPPLVVLLQYARTAGVPVEYLIDDQLSLPGMGEAPVRRGGKTRTPTAGPKAKLRGKRGKK